MKIPIANQQKCMKRGEDHFNYGSLYFSLIVILVFSYRFSITGINYILIKVILYKMQIFLI